MTIRTRLTLWYAGIFLVSTFLVLGLSYKHFVDEQQPERAATGVIEFLKREAAEWDDVVALVLWCALPGALLGLGGGWWLTRKALAPVAALSAAAEQVNDQQLRTQLPRSGNGDELDRLTQSFNEMTTRLDDSFQRIREFTLHASHELKTPLTVMRGECETALRDENLSPPQRERLLSQLDELDRLTRIVDGLTLLTKADAGQVSLNFEPVPLDQLVRDSFEDARILAHAKNLTVCLDLCEPAVLRGDRHRLRQLLLNLTDNAVKYSPPGGRIVYSLVRRETQAELKITNAAVPLPEDVTARVFDRFFRGDPSHSNKVDGCGLGLSIAKWIVCAHGGSISLTSTQDGLVAVVVRLPLSAL